MSNGRLKNYELTEAGKALLPKTPDDKRGKMIHIPASEQGDPMFRCYAGLLEDYHCDTLMKRQDERGLLYVKPKSSTTAAKKKE